MKILCLVITLSFLAIEASSTQQNPKPSASARKLNYPRPHKKRFFKRQNKAYKPTNHLKVFNKMRQRGMGKKILYTRKDRAYRAILKPRYLKGKETPSHQPSMKKIMLKNSAIDKIVEQAESEAKNHRKLKSSTKKQTTEKKSAEVQAKPKKEADTPMKKTRKLSNHSYRKNKAAPIASQKPKKVNLSRKARIEANKHFQHSLRSPSKGKHRKLVKKGQQKSSGLAQPAKDGSIELQKNPTIEVDTEAMKEDLGII